MPTIMSHALVPLAVAAALGSRRIPASVMTLGAVVAMLPDADVIGFKFGIAYADQFGHRGASHSFVAAAGFAALVCAILPSARSKFCAVFLFLSAASHGLLDTLTNGGLGAALLWPFSEQRFHAPVTPIRVSPIGGRFFSARGVETLMSEALWIWVPCGLLFGLAHRLRRVPPMPVPFDIAREHEHSNKEAGCGDDKGRAREI
jgi:inner membrane protein